MKAGTSMNIVSPGRLAAVALALMLASPLPAAAGELDRLDRGPKVGERIPHALRALDQEGRYRDFKALARRRGLIILFSRSLDW